jgi:hypothetical protein
MITQNTERLLETASLYSILGASKKTFCVNTASLRYWHVYIQTAGLYGYARQTETIKKK